MNADTDDLQWFNNDEKILDYLKEKEPQTRKTVLAALYVITENMKYNKQMVEDCKHTNEIYKEQKKTKKQEEGWMTQEEIKTIYDGLFEKVNLMFRKKLIADYPTIVNFILLGALGGVSGVVPRRSMDYTELKIKNYNPPTDNYYKKGKFYFNVYKTSKDYGLQTLDVKESAPEFNKILEKWASCCPSDYMLFSTSGKKLTSSQVTRYLHGILGKTISCDILRHIYLTDRYGKINAEMQKTSQEMGHSMGEQNLYIKK